MTLFERRLAEALNEYAGPTEAVDQFAIARRAAQAPRPQIRWAWRPAFSVAAAALAVIAAVTLAAVFLRSTFPPVIGGSPSPQPTTTPGEEATGSDSPWVAFLYHPSSTPRFDPDDLWAIRADGSGAHELLPNLARPLIAWSQDGTRLLAVTRESGGTHVYVAEVGDEIGPLVDTGFTTGADAACRHPQSSDVPCANAAFSFAPDGNQIVFVQRCRTEESGCMLLTLLDLQTGDQTPLGATRFGDERPLAMPAWSPDGERIAFTRENGLRLPEISTGFPASDLYVIDADGSNLRQIDTGGVSVEWPTWSPDSSQLAFASVESEGTRELHRNIHTVRADGSDMQSLTVDGSSGEPQWLPDGQIRFTRGDSGTSWRVSADGSNRQIEIEGEQLLDAILADTPGSILSGSDGRTFTWQPLE